METHVNYEVLVALAALMCSVLGALFAGIWQLSGLKTKIEAAVGQLKLEVEEFKHDRSMLDEIPLLKLRIDHLERHQRQRTSRARMRDDDDDEDEEKHG